MTDNRARKIVAIDAIVRNNTYSETSGLVTALKKALFVLPADQLDNLSMLVSIKETEAGIAAKGG